MTATLEQTVYKEGEFAGFMRNKDQFGAFSNMHANFPFYLGSILVSSNEALYQALRFPAFPERQEYVLSAGYAIGSKRRAYESGVANFTALDGEVSSATVPGWVSNGINVKAMRVCLWLKLCAYQDAIESLYALAGGKPIVEISFRDTFWGATPQRDQVPAITKGHNKLGKLWGEVMAESALIPKSEWLNHVAKLSDGLYLYSDPLSKLIPLLSTENKENPEPGTLDLF